MHITHPDTDHNYRQYNFQQHNNVVDDPFEVELDEHDADQVCLSAMDMIALALREQEKQAGKPVVPGLTLQDIQDLTGKTYYVVRRIAADGVKNKDLQVREGSGRKPALYFLPHQFLVEPASDGGFELSDDEILALLRREESELKTKLETVRSDIRSIEVAMDVRRRIKDKLIKDKLKNQSPDSSEDINWGEDEEEI